MAFDSRLLSGVGVLAAVVAGGSFVRAAEALGLSASGVSRALARLEGRLGIRLLDRTTRSVTLTDEGRRFYEQVGPLLAGIEEAAILASGSAAIVRGRLRVNVDPFFSRLVLASHLAGFLDRHPELALELITSNALVDLVAEGFDLAVRFGAPPAGSLIARKLIETRILTVASPAYIARHGRPAHPSEIPAYNCIHFRDPLTGQPFDWEFHKGGEVLKVQAVGRLIVSDVSTMQSACIAGAGLAQVMAFGVEALIARGDLIELFPDWNGEMFPLHIFYPSRQHQPAKVRAFTDFCLAAIR
ncbi:MAG TPA: LysR family transcriptional regulator [Aliidongia sp.]|nr:LysR family transcriptional regulator [Aliidongia sp.]